MTIDHHQAGRGEQQIPSAKPPSLHSAKHLKESLGQGEDMERDDERVETHISGVRNLSEEAREMRAAGRKLVGENEEKADDLSDYRRLSGSVKKLKESVDAQRAEVNQAVKKIKQRGNALNILHRPRLMTAQAHANVGLPVSGDFL